MENRYENQSWAAHEAATPWRIPTLPSAGGRRPCQGTEVIDTAWVPVPRPVDFSIPEPSRAIRDPKRARYGAVISSIVDPFRNRIILSESALERRWAQVLIADPRVAEVREQQLLRYRDANGEKAKHYFDLLVFWTNGEVTAFACKYERQTGSKLKDLLRHVANTVGDAFADHYDHLSEVGLSDRRVHNARRVIECGLDEDRPAQQAIKDVLPYLGKHARMAELDAIVGDGERSSRAAIAMIQQGLFGLKPNAWIGFTDELRNLFTN